MSLVSARVLRCVNPYQHCDTAKGPKMMSAIVMLTAFRVWVMLKFKCNNMNSSGGGTTDRLRNEPRRGEWRLRPANWIMAH